MNSLAWSLVKIPAAKYAEMQSHMRVHFPEEACGLLAGTITGNEILVHAVLPVENQLHSSVSFRMEPNDQLKALNWIDEQGYTLVGIFHSHPNGPHQPSQTDLAEAFYPEVAYLIWYRTLEAISSIAALPPEKRAFVGRRGNAFAPSPPPGRLAAPGKCFTRTRSRLRLALRAKHPAGNWHKRRKSVLPDALPLRRRQPAPLTRGKATRERGQTQNVTNSWACRAYRLSGSAFVEIPLHLIAEEQL